MEVKRYLVLLVCFVEATVLAGALYGWPSLVYVLEADGLYHELCPEYNGTETSAKSQDFQQEGETKSLSPHQNSSHHSKQSPGCTEQKVRLSLSFTVAVVSFGVAAFPIGMFFDKFGLRTTRTVAAFIGLLTYFQLAVASPGTEWLLITGAVGIGITSFALLLTSCHVALLAGAKSSTVNAIIVGGINTSFAYEAVKVATEHGIPRTYGLLFIGSFWLVVLVSSWLLLPPFKVNPQTPNCDSEWETEVKDSLNSKTKEIKASPEQEVSLDNSDDKESLRNTVLSAIFVLFLYWFAANNVRINMVTNSYHAWITDVMDNNHSKVSFYTDILAYVTLAGTLLSPLAGTLTDCMRAKYASQPGGKYLVNVPALALTSILLIALTVPLFFHTEVAISTSVIIFAFGKSYTYSTASIFVSLMCPSKYFGVMFGILHLVGGVSSAVMYPYLLWVSHSGSFLPVNALIVTSTVLTLSLPLWLLVKWRRCLQQPMLPQNHQDISKSTN